MTPERWQKVKEVFSSALQHEPTQRSAFLADACVGDEALHHEVESLLASHEKGGSFIDSPAYEAAADMLSGDQELRAGQTIASYEIISFISRGGMGEVYLAHDKRLRRKVALKLLPASFTNDGDRLRRFEQEARAASALNHPNIITIYEIREANLTLMIAAEFVEGETLRQHLLHTPLGVAESLRIAIQIADALAAAHKAGIIHRDIKPDNIMLRPDGYVKVLDFGLAKLIEPVSPTSIAEAPTKQVKTGSGMIMGTVGYMSPEQARGQTVDARSDIFSLGAVIYEMVAGAKPFEGETPSDVFAAILKSEPPLLSHFAPVAPAELVRIVTKALRKDREQRYQTAKDLLLDLKSLKEEQEFQTKLDRSVAPNKSTEASGASSHSTSPTSENTLSSTSEIKTAVSAITHSLSSEIRGHKTGAILAVAALVVAMIVGVFALNKFLNRRRSATLASTEAPQVLNARQVTAWSGLDMYPSFSPDGNSIAYSSDHNGTFEIYINQLAPGGREIQLTTDGQQNFEPAWSPDGKLIAYYSKTRGGIWLVPAFGGAARQLTVFGSRPNWSPDGSVIAFQSNGLNDFGPSASGAMPPSTILTVPVVGGSPKQITQVGNPVGGHGSPSWSPNGKRIVFATSGGNRGEISAGIRGGIWSVSATGDDLKQLSERGQFDPVYSPDGESLYFAGGDPTGGSWALLRLRVSPQSGEPLGEAVVIKNTGAVLFKHLRISADGKKIACTALQLANNLSAITLAQASGEAKGKPVALTEDTTYRRLVPAFSPDGQKIAYDMIRIGTNGDVWVMDADGKNPTQLTTDPAVHNWPTWFPEGDRIAYSSINQGKRTMRAINLQTGQDQLLFELDQNMELPRLSPDGKQFAFNSNKSGTINVWTIPVEGGRTRQLTFDQELMGYPSWSPDGHFIAFEMKRGDDTHVGIIPSSGGEPVQLTFDHGQSWVYSWSPDGERIAFAGQRNGVWNVWWVSVKDKTQKQVTNYTKPNAYTRFPAWSPLGDRIVYEYSETTGNIWLMELK